MSTNQPNNLFTDYLSNNLQLGVADLLEVTALAQGKDLRSRRYRVDAGERNDFKPIISDAARQSFTTSSRHICEAEGDVVTYEYFYLGDQVVAIVYIQVNYKYSNASLVALEEVYGILDSDLAPQFTTNHRNVINLRVSGDGEISVKQTRLLDNEHERAFDAFYPFIPGGSIEQFVADYFGNRAPILFFIGPPGTGKSTLLRYMASRSDNNTYVIYDDATKSRTEALDHFYDQQGRILAIEDADKHLSKRENGNEVMAAYLNYTDGVIRDTNKKLVISTNLSSVSQVDSALLRAGRCYAVIEFRFLTPEEAYAARLASGLEMDGFDPHAKDAWGLAEVLCDEPFGFVSKRKVGIGFTG